LSAPCGYGKTSLLASWRDQSVNEPVAWLTLESGDGNRARFWAQVANAVERARPGAGRRATTVLRARGASVDVAVHELLADLAVAAPLTIVLDDLHVIEDSECLALLGYAVEHLPSGVRIMIGTREDPPLPLGRLRAHGLLGEVRARDLAFTVEEAREILVQTELLDLDDDEVEMLVGRTEGWPVAVYLTALWLRDQDDPRSKVHELAAGQRYVGEFLTDEVLSSLDTSTRSFLVRTSVLTYLSGPLCDAVLERDDSNEMLRNVSSANLLIARLEPDSEWFRIHPLFRELLRLELDHDHPEAVVQLHGRAATWLEEHGYFEGAVSHALAAGKHQEAAALISNVWAELLSRGEAETLIRLVDSLPLELVLANPELAAGSALATWLARRPVHERLRWLAITERSRAESPHTWSARAAITSSLARAIAIDGDVRAAALHARRALKLVAEHGLEHSGVSALAALAYSLYLGGMDDAACEYAARAMATPEAPERPHAALSALGVLALAAADAGRIEEAASKAQLALELARDHGLSAAASTHIAHLARARAMAAKGRLREAETACELGERLCRMPDPSVPHAYALLVLAEVRTRRGHLPQASEALAAARLEVATFADPGRLPHDLAAAKRGLRLARKSHSPSGEPLSSAELAVLRLLATNLSQRQVGRQLFLSVNTIKTHTQSIYRKLGVASRSEAVTRATALDLIEAN
jgi:LuxR family maltose regulon positive regulatory protein